MSPNGGTGRVLRANDPTVIGPYRLSARLGSGGMGTVYLGTDPSGRPAAVKVLHDDHDDDLASRRRFAREVVAVAAIDSPRVASLLDADPLDEQPWLATEYVPGPTLTASVLAAGPMVGDRLGALAVGTAEALCAVHAAGVVHRDLKPSNIMLAEDGPKIIDFGIVAGLPETVTASGVVLGSLGYIAPELLVDGGRPSSKADIFAWALTLVFASTGRPPFGDGSVEALLYRAVNTVPDLHAIPASLHGLVVAALDKDPGGRPTAEDLLGQLQESRNVLAPGTRDLDPPPADAPPADAPTAALAAAPTATLAPSAAFGPTADSAPEDPSTELLPAEAIGYADAGPTTAGTGHRRPSRGVLPAQLRARRRRVLLPAAGAAAALAVTATALVAAAPEDSSGATDEHRPTHLVFSPPTSTEPSRLSPEATASPGAVSTDPAASAGPTAQQIGGLTAPQGPTVTLDPPSGEPSSGKPRTTSQPSAAGWSKGTGRPQAQRTKPRHSPDGPA